MADNNLELNKLCKRLEGHHKDLTTKYNILVKRTNSIINTLKDVNTKLEYLSDKLSMFEFIEAEDGIEGYFDPYSQRTPEEYEETDDEDEDDE